MSSVIASRSEKSLGATPVIEDSAGEPSGIVVDQLGKQFRRKGGAVEALAGVDLTIKPGEFVSLIGPSGCGKSTLLRIIGGLIRPSTGVVSVAGQRPEQVRRAKGFGFVPQSPALLPWRTVLENVTLLDEIGRSRLPFKKRPGTGNAGAVSAGQRDPRALLEQAGLGKFHDSLPKQLSGGMQQRVNLVRAFVLGAPILLMDEPFAALDEITRNAMRYQLLEIWAQTNTTVVFVTHGIQEAVMLSDRVITMAARPGRVVDTETITLRRPRHEDMEDTEEFVKHVRHVRAALRRGWENG
jgi:NitT/TauT family transport system ATP-binding protein